MSLAILKEPAELGVDIVCGDGQPLGGALNFGGPSFGFLTTREKYLRQMPGRIVGKTVDRDGKRAYCLTLQTREQHIRREKATSNICSNHSLNAIGAAVYLSLVGKEGIQEVALNSFRNTQYLYQRLKEVRGIRIPYPPRIFNEFIWEVQDAPAVIDKLYEKNIIAGYFLRSRFPQHKNGILSCCTEKKTKGDIDNFVDTLAEVLHG
jgi:glycine dehydrogenase subunit 1